MSQTAVAAVPATATCVAGQSSVAIKATVSSRSQTGRLLFRRKPFHCFRFESLLLNSGVSATGAVCGKGVP
ncbi:MAG TPA: hypothetical protein VGH48_04955, partial [Caldimonas sp.]